MLGAKGLTCLNTSKLSDLTARWISYTSLAYLLFIKKIHHKNTVVIISNIPGPWVRDVCQDHWTPEPIHQQPEKESVDISNSKATHHNELVINIIINQFAIILR